MQAPRNALVVDDSRAMRGILSRILTGIGFTVLQAVDGEQALASLQESPDISLFCVDYNMPNMNGVDFVRAVRANPLYLKVPVVMVTTETHLSTLEQALIAGVDEYVMKPFTTNMLLDKLKLIGASVI